MLWVEDGIMIYNGTHSVFAGSRHPHLLGSKVREGSPEVADFNDNVMREPRDHFGRELFVRVETFDNGAVRVELKGRKAPQAGVTRNWP